MQLFKNNFIFKHYLDVYFDHYRNVLFLKNKNKLFYLNLPSYYSYKYLTSNSKENFSLLFSNSWHFSSVLKYFISSITRLVNFSYVKLRLKGLGFRIREISSNLYKFFFNYINFIYFHVPFGVLVKARRKRILLISNDLVRLEQIFSQFLLLRKVNVYRGGGFVFPRQIFFFKTGKKQI